jgi:hypothetical protein
MKNVAAVAVMLVAVVARGQSPDVLAKIYRIEHIRKVLTELRDEIKADMPEDDAKRFTVIFDATMTGDNGKPAKDRLETLGLEYEKTSLALKKQIADLDGQIELAEAKKKDASALKTKRDAANKSLDAAVKKRNESVVKLLMK